jgi:predicted dithiol-disulfide oxidoreductase (DUF899 family)
LICSITFGDKDTLIIYSMMFGPERERACPMCTAMLTSWEGTARNLRERVALAVTARSPIERLLEFKKERGWQNLQIYSDSHLSKRWQVFKLHNRRLDSVEGSSKRFTGSRVNEGLNGSCALGEIAERLAP